MEESDEPYVDADDFPREQGDRMCPRCGCCAVGVGHYSPPEVVAGTLTATIRIQPNPSSLSREPYHDPSDEPEAWFCRGGCDDRGEHYKSKRTSVTFIGRVKKANPSAA
jgi:hypothetical protein